jgi:predicted nucleic acid-binding protein
MSGDVTRDYWDACVFLSWINDIPNRAEVIDALFHECASAKNPVEIVTSALSVVEVSFGEMERTQKALDPGVQQNISDLWSPGGPITLIEFYPAIANDARDLVQQAMIEGRGGLRAADAIHLATAKRLNVERFLTYDDRLLKTGQALGINAVLPTLRVAQLFVNDQDQP